MEAIVASSIIQDSVKPEITSSSAQDSVEPEVASSSIQDSVVSDLNEVTQDHQRPEISCVQILQKLQSLTEEFEIYKNDDLVLEQHLRDLYEQKIYISEWSIMNFCAKTTDNQMSDSEKKIRLRISPKSVHSIKSRTRKPIERLINEIIHPQGMPTVVSYNARDSMEYSHQMKDYGFELYEKLNNCQVRKIGMIISKTQPWLCVRVDGVVFENGCLKRIVELKCPITCQNQPVINKTKKKFNVPYLKFVNDGAELNKKQDLYTQIQVKMYLTGMKVCDLFILSQVPDGSLLVKVDRDEDFIKSVILKSEEFYFNHCLPNLHSELLNDSDNV